MTKQLLIMLLLGGVMATVVTGCSAQITSGQFGDAINVPDVKRVIDTNLRSAFLAVNPLLSISPADCPERIDVSNGKHASCVVTIDGQSLTIDVRYDGPPQKFIVAKDSSFYDMSAVERLEASRLLSEQSVHVTVHCGLPRFRLLAVGTSFACEVRGATSTTLHLKVLDGGALSADHLPGAHPPGWMATAMRDNKAGRPVRADGSTVAAWIRQRYAESMPAVPPTAISISCPHVMDLTAGRAVICSERVLGNRMRLRATLSDKGLGVMPLDALIDRSKIQQMAQDEYNERLRDNGRAQDASVRCDPGVAVIGTPGRFYCDLAIGGEAMKLEVSVEDYKGTVHWRAVPSAPAPVRR